MVNGFFYKFADNKLKLSDLLPNTSYSFNVRARNAVGMSDSVSVSVTTLLPRKQLILYICDIFHQRIFTITPKYF